MIHSPTRPLTISDIPSFTPAVTEEDARHEASGYLGMDVGIPFSAIDGVFVPLERPIWQFTIRFRLPKLGTLGMMGNIDVDAQTGNVIPMTNEAIHSLQQRANAIVQFRKSTMS